MTSGDYGRVYDTPDDFLLTERDAEASEILDTQNIGRCLVVKALFNKGDNAFWFVSGIHFTKDTVASPSESKIE